MRSLAVQDTQLVVLAGESSQGGVGGLFERFVAKLLADQYGFDSPSTRNLNVTSDGIELDVVARHRLTGGLAIAECKAYSRNVKAAELTNFYGKLGIERFTDAATFGLMCALPRLTADGEEKARSVEANDPAFRYLSANDLASALLQGGLVSVAPSFVTDMSDRAVLLTEHGLYAACIVLDSQERTPLHVAAWAASGAVPASVLELLASSAYANTLPVHDVGVGHPAATPTRDPTPVSLTAVVGSGSDFEYQLPASPKFFVGRRPVVQRMEEVLNGERGSVVVLNAQSGWGKSSLALKLSDLVAKRRGVSRVLDTRTADQPRYVVEVLRRVATDAETAGVLSLPAGGSWATLESALSTLRGSTWHERRPVVAFFDQFENVFRDFELTRSFRDLALGCRDVPGPFIVGFAWKTDLVGWTEGHPYRLRDDIRGSGTVIVIDPFGPREVDVILGRMAKEAGVRLLPDLRSRLRAYSQGLPWLLKKLADHVLRELQSGETQEGLLAESLNVVALFEADLAELNPTEHTVLRHVARYAPIEASEVTERFGPGAVQSLVDRRLVVQVGDRLDTYWDTFRDFINTGNVPVQESWILRQTPRSVGRLLLAVVAAGGDASVRRLVAIIGTSDRAIFNLSRELRLLGVAAYEPNRVRLVEEVVSAADPEQEMRRRVGTALRRHRAYSSLRKLAERSGGRVTLEGYARDLPNAFPAVDVAPASWVSYARAFLFWMEYAGLVTREGADYTPTSEPTAVPSLRLLDSPAQLKYRPGVPQIAPRRAIEFLLRVHEEGELDLPSEARPREAVGTLFALGAVTVTQARRVVPAVPELVNNGVLEPRVLRRLLASVPGGGEALQALDTDPRTPPAVIGEIIAHEAHATWSQDTTRHVGGHFRSWAKVAGVPVRFARRHGRQEATAGRAE